MTAPGPRRPARSTPLGPPMLLGAGAVILALNLIPHGETLLYPLAVFTTWAHETCHALAATALGAHVQTVLIRPDTSGLTTYLYGPGFGRLSHAVVTSAGYLGAALAAAGLLAAARRPRAHQVVFGVLALGLAVTAALWVRTAFGVVALLALAAAATALALRATPVVARVALLLLGLQAGLDAVLDIRALYYVHGTSDAQTMSQVVGLPAAFWATLWLLAGGAVLARVLWQATRSGKP